MSVVRGSVNKAAQGAEDIENNELLVPFKSRKGEELSDKHVPFCASVSSQSSLAEICRSSRQRRFKQQIEAWAGDKVAKIELRGWIVAGRAGHATIEAGGHHKGIPEKAHYLKSTVPVGG